MTDQPTPAAERSKSDPNGRVAPTDAGLRAIQQLVLRAFAATGGPPTVTELQQTTEPDGVDPAHVLAELDASDLLRLDTSGQISAAYPFSAVATPHRVQIAGGPEVFAMCAIDALGMAPMLDKAVVIRSADPASGDPITIALDPHHSPAAGVWDPAGAVVYCGQACGSRTGPAAGSAAEISCGFINFFADEAGALAWAEAHPEVTGEVLTQVDAVRLGAHIFGRLLTSPLEPNHPTNT